MRPCKVCGCPTLPAATWKAAEQALRDVWKAAGARSHQGRGLCSVCYRRARQGGTLADHERRNQPLAVILEEWDHLADPMLPVKQEAARLAPQLGIRAQRLENIIYAHIGSRYAGGWGERFKGRRAA